MTLAGSDWFQRVGANVGNEKQQTFALAYAMAHGRDILPEDIKEARKTVVKWGRSLKCRYSELTTAVELVHEQWDMLDTGETGESASVGEMSLMLAAMTGLAPEVWEFQCSIQYVVEMISKITAQNAAESESSKFDPRIQAERALGLVVHRIRKRHEKESK